MTKLVYNFSVKEQVNAKAFLIEGKSPDGKQKITVGMLYYDYGIPKEVINNVAVIFADQLNQNPLEIES